MRRKRPSDVIRGLMDRHMLRNERVNRGRVLRPVGPKREVVVDETCETPRLVSTTTPGASATPGSAVSILRPQGGFSSVAVEAVVTGRNVGSESQGHTIPAGLPAMDAVYLSFWYIDSSHVDVKTLNASGDVVETVHSLTIPSGTLSRESGCIRIISGDANGAPDNSFTLSGGSLVWLVDYGTGDFTELFDLSAGDLNQENIVEMGLHWDSATSQIFLASNNAGDFNTCNLYKTTTAGGAPTLVKTYNPADSDVDVGVVWASDRAIVFLSDFGDPIEGCTEIPFDGSAVTERTDTPTSTNYVAAVANLHPAGGTRYFLDLDDTQTWFDLERMPLSGGGSAASEGWSVSTFFPGQAHRSFADLVGDDLTLWPVLKSAGGGEVYILHTDVTGGAPNTGDNLTQVSDATTGPIDPWCILPLRS